MSWGTGGPILGLHVLSYGQAWPDVLDQAVRADRLGYDREPGADHLHATGADPLKPFFGARRAADAETVERLATEVWPRLD